ncbi:MAG: peptidoglycan DD-metalloendopeptidase family protein [Azoarcus sp.]|jgi:septal ring factor EnvC (AmiA/AmiB activator)|nr:peptidoglycan DD-metalloendopeptidase family protein [Azoarcus sp.]
MAAVPVRRILATILVAWAGLTLPSVPHAQTGKSKAEIRAKRSDLSNIKRRIGNLQRDLEKTEAAQAEAIAAMAEAEREVSKAARALRQTMAERTETESQLATLEAGQRELEDRIAARQEELADWLRRNYIYGTGNDIAALLAARDPNQFVRDTYYLERLGRVRLDLIENLRTDLQHQSEQASHIAARRKTIARIEEDRRQRQGKLDKTHATRRESLEKITQNLKSQRERVAALKVDEERLTQVINTLVQNAIEAEAQAEAARRKQAEAKARPGKSPKSNIAPPPVGKEAPEPIVGKVREAAGPASAGARFAQLRGRLNFPVTGELIGRFGAARAGRGMTWRGVFIRAAKGADVHAVSDGEVVFSDWLRGYGNLLIIDHGSGYLSIYGNNDALYKETGNAVRGGETIASVGASGVEADSGLYFEIRHRGQAIDPMQWVKLR